MFDGELLLANVRLSAVSHNPGLGPGDPAGLPLLLLHAVDHVLLLLLPRHQGVRADDVDLGRRLALHHVHDVVSVGDVEPGQGEQGSFMFIAVFFGMCLPNQHWTTNLQLSPFGPNTLKPKTVQLT